MKSKAIVPPHITLVIGKNSDHVVSENKKYIKAYVKSRKNRKLSYRVLIIDFSGKYSVSEISKNQVKTFKNKICVIGNEQMDYSEKIDLLENVANNYSDGLLVVGGFEFDDKHFANACSILTACNRSKKRNVLIYVGDSIFNAPVNLIQNTNYIRLHYGHEYVYNDRVINKIHDPQLYVLASHILNDMICNTTPIQTSKCIHIDIDKNKILGCTETEFVHGYKNYIATELRCCNTIEHLEKLINPNLIGKFDRKFKVLPSNV